jgi:Putative peptidoglycan binding domain
MAKSLDYNPVTIGLLWTFATGAKLFVYQSAVIAVAATYIYFDVKAFLKISAVMTVAKALILLLLVPLYWPLIGLPWRASPAEQVVTATAPVTPASDRDIAKAPAEARPHVPQDPGAAVIRQVQARLTQMGFDPGPLDGRLGPKTDAALRQFQAASGLPVNGRLERATRRALGVTPSEPACNGGPCF